MAAVLLVIAGCATSPPKEVDNACAIFRERPAWWEAMRRSEQRWGMPAQVQLAILRQESSFREDAKPPRDTVLGIPMWWRVSSAYGYGQVKDETWDWYREKTGNTWADRDEIEDVSDFVGWYGSVSQRTLGIAPGDAYNQYLAYHEGHTGWKRRTYQDKPWLVQVARKVEGYAASYGRQLRSCSAQLAQERDWLPL